MSPYREDEETIHVPFLIHSPKLFSERSTANMLTSYVDIHPTLLGLANINVDKIANELRQDHIEVHPLVGRDLTPFILKKENFQLQLVHEPVYFVSDDDVTRSLSQVSFSGQPKL